MRMSASSSKVIGHNPLRSKDNSPFNTTENTPEILTPKSGISTVDAIETRTVTFGNGGSDINGDILSDMDSDDSLHIHLNIDDEDGDGMENIDDDQMPNLPESEVLLLKDQNGYINGVSNDTSAPTGSSSIPRATGRETPGTVFDQS